MIVDDQPDVRYLVRVILEDSGADVVVVAEASGGEEALMALDAANPDVVVLDAMMPIRDGFETAELIRSKRPGQAILLCSALVDEAVLERAREAGIAACLPKEALDALAPAVLDLARRGRT
jgi:two-component system, chemotaxis family, chemotaxis protein CheY